MDSRDAYRRECSRQSLLQSRDVYKQDALLDHRDSYGGDGVVEHLNLRPLKLEVRHRDHIAMNDPYILCRACQSYRDPVYTRNLSPERDRYLPVGRRYKYRSREDPLTEYRSTRSFTESDSSGALSGCNAVSSLNQLVGRHDVLYHHSCGRN